jgi:anti-sigma B factor antagonist
VESLLDIDLVLGDGFAVVSVAGELDVSNVDELRQMLMHVFGDHQPRLIVIDCAGLQFLDSTGLGVFVGIHKRLVVMGSRLAVANVNARVGKPIRITGLDRVFHVHWANDEHIRPWEPGASMTDICHAVGLQAEEQVAAIAD